MYLEKLQLLNFKNYEEAELDLYSEINCFLGNNGQGKTNLLDAIYYLAFSKSFFNPIDSQLIRGEEAFMTLTGTFFREEEQEKIYVGLKKGQKKRVKRNKKVYERIADHIGLIPLVMTSPSDSLLIIEGSEIRRKFLDLIISQYDRRYLDDLIQYNKALSQRNRLLKKFMEIRRFDEESLVIWDEQLIKYGEPVSEARNKFIVDFVPLFQKQYQFISGNKERVELEYSSHLNETTFKESLLNNRDRDRRLTYTSSGVHKDDLGFNLGDKPLKKFGSQGQQKTYLLSLKLAQAEFLKNHKKITPILLLDDIYDKLDEDRVAKLMEVVQKDWFGQVFITDTHIDRLPNLFTSLKIAYKAFAIEKGEVKDV